MADKKANDDAVNSARADDKMLPPKNMDRRQEHGAQVHLTGKARAAARGAVHGTITENVHEYNAAVQRGEAADGTTPDGSTPDGRLPPDTLEGADQAVYGEPGQGEGKVGMRIGDDEVAEAQADAMAKREAAKKK